VLRSLRLEHSPKRSALFVPGALLGTTANNTFGDIRLKLTSNLISSIEVCFFRLFSRTAYHPRLRRHPSNAILAIGITV
jgi:hypothetical protein